MSPTASDACHYRTDCVAEKCASLCAVPDLGAFSGKTRGGVSVREGQGVVLMCTPPPHSPGKKVDLQSKPEGKPDIVSSPLHSGVVNKALAIHHESYDNK